MELGVLVARVCQSDSVLAPGFQEWPRFVSKRSGILGSFSPPLSGRYTRPIKRNAPKLDQVPAGATLAHETLRRSRGPRRAARAAAGALWQQSEDVRARRAAAPG